jgi:MFS family permease
MVGPRDRWRLALVGLAVLLTAADTYVVVVALPAIMNGVGVGLDRLQRATPIISGFLLGYTAVLPLIGRLADLVGTDLVFAGCLVVFVGGSVVTATAHDLPVVVAGRALQGLGGGGLVPVALAMVAARWPPDARGLPLGVVGALQELGSVIGPLYGAGIVALASWRAIFWINLPITAVVGAAFWLTRRPPHPRARAGGRGTPRGLRDAAMVLASVGAAGLVVGLDAPARLSTSTTLGRAWSPVAGGTWSAFTTPVVLAAAGLLVGCGCWLALARPGAGTGVRLRQARTVLGRADLPGALLIAAILGCIVVLFSTADPSRQVVASSAPWLAPLAALLLVVFWWRQRQAAVPLIEPGAFAARPAWGALAVNLGIGAALMAALVDVPLFARATADPNSEVGAALVLLRLLVAVPVGAILGGLLCRSRRRAPVVAAAGMALATGAFLAMSSWSETALGGGPRWSDLELVICGLGFGLAIAPVNVAILGAVKPTSHALAGALAVVARTVGMLAGLSALTAIGLHRFYEAQARIGSPVTLCPAHPTSCPAYDRASTSALLTELHTIFAGAAICAAVAGILALLLLRAPPVSADAGDTTTSSALPRLLG